MTRLGECWEKFRRADHHLDQLTTEIGKWMADYNDRPPAIKKTYHPEEHLFTFAFTESRPVSPDWSLIVGDAINNFRACLDYLAWQLVDIGSEPKPLAKPQAIHFPYVVRWKPTQTPREAFDVLAPRMLPGVDPTFVGIIERYQPYRWTARVGTHPLALLNRLSNHDKHQQLQVTSVLHQPFAFGVIHQAHCKDLDMMFHRAAQFEADAELMRVHVTPTGTGDPEVKMGITTTPVIVLRNEFEAVVDVLRPIRGMVHQLLSEFSAMI